MTIRTRHFDSITVYAGRFDELAAIADEYADGRRTMPAGLTRGMLTRIAVQLRTGIHPVHNLGPLRFYSDHPDGSPHVGPFAPDADPEWEARQKADSQGLGEML